MINLDSILKSRNITLPTKVLESSQGYDFFSGHVWMWELDCEEGWEPKNSCFWTVVLKKTLESPLDCKEIQPVHPKGDQSLVFIGRTDAEAETPILGPPHMKSWLIGKDPDAERDWGQEEKRMTEDEMAGWHHQQMDMSLSKLRELVMDREAWVMHFMGLQRFRHYWATELNWTEWLALMSTFSSTYWPSVCLLYIYLYLSLQYIFWKSCFFCLFLYWAVWAVSVFWKLILVDHIVYKYFLPFFRLYFKILFIVSFVVQ